MVLYFKRNLRVAKKAANRFQIGAYCVTNGYRHHNNLAGDHLKGALKILPEPVPLTYGRKDPDGAEAGDRPGKHEHQLLGVIQYKLNLVYIAWPVKMDCKANPFEVVFLTIFIIKICIIRNEKFWNSLPPKTKF
jgi:hypothetical protein